MQISHNCFGVFFPKVCSGSYIVERLKIICQDQPLESTYRGRAWTCELHATLLLSASQSARWLQDLQLLCSCNPFSSVIYPLVNWHKILQNLLYLMPTWLKYTAEKNKMMHKTRAGTNAFVQTVDSSKLTLQHKAKMPRCCTVTA